jgi:hypothetical protein
MASFFSIAAPVRAVEYISDTVRLDSLQEQKLRAFLETLAPDQLSFLYRTGCIIDTLVESEPMPQIEGEMSFPDASEHKPFDYEEWKNQKDHRIR